MIRELILVSADLAATAWFATGLAPGPKVPPHLVLRAIAAPDEADRFATGPVPIAVARTRLDDGDRCIIAEDSATHMIVAQLWLSRRARTLAWIGCAVRPLPAHMLLYNAWVEPALRGPGLHWAMASFACQTATASGVTGICAGLERAEFAPFARKYADMGLAVIVPYAGLWTARLFGAVGRLQLPPPRALVRLSREIGRNFRGGSCA